MNTRESSLRPTTRTSRDVGGWSHYKQAMLVHLAPLLPSVQRTWEHCIPGRRWRWAKYTWQRTKNFKSIFWQKILTCKLPSCGWSWRKGGRLWCNVLSPLPSLCRSSLREETGCLVWLRGKEQEEIWVYRERVKMQWWNRKWKWHGSMVHGIKDWMGRK